MDTSTIAAIAALILTILGIIGKMTGGIAWLVEKWKIWRQPKSSSLIDVPKKTVILLPVTRPGSFWWHLGSARDAPAMQIVGDLNVTNISKFSITLMGAKMKRPAATGHVLVRSTYSNAYGTNHKIAVGGVSDLRFDFWVQPPIRSKGEEFKADIAIIDQFGNEHWLKGLVFPYR